MALWCRLTVLARSGAVVATWRIGGGGRPGLAVVDTVARLQLRSRRRGRRVVVSEASPELLELLELAGLLELGGVGRQLGAVWLQTPPRHAPAAVDGVHDQRGEGDGHDQGEKPRIPVPPTEHQASDQAAEE